MVMTGWTRDELATDVAFLVSHAGLVQHGAGAPASASTSLVALAYGFIDLERVIMPSSSAELAACERTFERLPVHRRSESVSLALARQREALVRRCG